MIMKVMVTAAMANLLIVPQAVVAGGSYSISPHAPGVCAPNYSIAEVVETDVDNVEEPDIEDDVDVKEPTTIEGKVKVNRDPESKVWYHIENEECPEHEWAECTGEEHFRYCLNCGCTEPLDDEPEDEPEEPEDVEDEQEPENEGAEEEPEDVEDDEPDCD